MRRSKKTHEQTSCCNGDTSGGRLHAQMLLRSFPEASVAVGVEISTAAPQFWTALLCHGTRVVLRAGSRVECPGALAASAGPAEVARDAGGRRSTAEDLRWS
jgi:hypothetical protein